MIYRYLTSLTIVFLTIASHAFAQGLPDEQPAEQVDVRWENFQPEFTEYVCPFNDGLKYDPAEFVCGYVLVPEDRTNPASRLIRLSVLQIKSRQKSPEGGAVIRLTGGPGAPALGAGRIRAYQNPDNFFIRDIADLIFFDQRGTGFSEGFFCRAVPDAYQYGLPITPDGETAYRSHMRKCLEEARAQHVAVDAYSTWHNALDVRDIRRALGYDQWTLFGVSYGTALGQAVIEVDTEGVRAAILDSVVPADMSTLGGWRATGLGFRNSLQVLNASCQSHPACKRDVGNLEARFEAAIQSYDDTPLILDGLNIGLFQHGRVFLNGEMAANFVFQMLYRANLYKDLPILLDVLESRDGETIKLYAEQASWPLDHWVGQGMRLIANCRGGMMVSDQSQAEAEQGEPDFTRWLDLIDQTDDCKAIYGIRPDPSVKPLETSLPILIAAGAADPITPPAYSQAILPGLTNATYVEFPHTGHGALMTHFYGCGGQILRDFIKAPEQAIDASCAADIPTPDFLTRLHKTKGPFGVARDLQAGKWPKLPALAILGLAVTLIAFPMGAIARRIDRMAIRNVGRARTASWLAALMSLAAVGTAIWYTQKTIANHPMALPVGVLPGAVIAGWLSIGGALLSLYALMQMLRFRQHGQPVIGTIVGISLTALLAVGLCIYILSIGFAPF